MKKKIIALTLCIAMFAVGAIGSTLAYFKSTDEEVNTFTVGRVKIELIEQQRNEDHTALEDFTNDKPLVPIVGSAQGEKDEFGMPLNAANYMDKIVTVKNTGKTDAYVRLFYAIPEGIDAPSDPSANALHINYGNFYTEQYLEEYPDLGTWFSTLHLWNWRLGEKPNYTYPQLADPVTIEGVEYRVYYATYKDVVHPGEETARALNGVYLDKDVDYNEDGHLSFRGRDLGLDENSVIKIPVFAQAIQAAGFATAADAFAAFDSGAEEPANPWAE